MCGLSGYIGLDIAAEDKLMLILGLGDGIDGRGGHSCGYASVTFSDKAGESDDVKYARKKGTWIRARMRFVEGAAGDICLMHARYATCGSREDPMNAHPFAIRRGGRVVMWGAHNGMVPDAFKSAKLNNRDINVDSQEIFELLADKNYEGIRDMAGYGVVTWIDTDHRGYVNLCRLSQHSDICVVSVKGGVVWGSTWKIVREALKVADLEVDREFKIDEIGRVYRIRADGVFKTKLSGIQVGYYNKYTKSRTEHGSSSSVATAKPANDEIDENAVVETKEPGECYSSGCSTTGSGAYSPLPSSWKKEEKAGVGSDADDDEELLAYYRNHGWIG